MVRFSSSKAAAALLSVRGVGVGVGGFWRCLAAGGRAADVFFSSGKCWFWRATHGLVFPKCRGSNSVNFASLIEVVAAHTAENESSQVCLCFL